MFCKQYYCTRLVFTIIININHIIYFYFNYYILFESRALMSQLVNVKRFNASAIFPGNWARSSVD